MAKFTNDVGTPVTPKYLEIINKGVVTMENTTTRPCLNVYHFRRLNAWTTVGLTNLLGAFDAAINQYINALLCDNYDLPVISGRFMDDPTAAEETIGSSYTPGTITTDSLPLRVTVTAQLFTGFRGRSYHGSKHYAPIPEAATLRDELDATPLANWNSAVGRLTNVPVFTDSAGNQWGAIVLSPTLSNLTANPSIFTGADVIATDVNKIIGSMKRRRERIGT